MLQSEIKNNLIMYRDMKNDDMKYDAIGKNSRGIKNFNFLEPDNSFVPVCAALDTSHGRLAR